MVLAFTAVTFAANNVRLTTTVPNIPKSTCYQAGTDTMEFDGGSKLRDGDVIQFTLNNKTTVCKDINMFLSLGTGVLIADPSFAVSASNAADTLTFVNPLGANDIGFVVRATNSDTAGGQIITLTLRQRIIATGALVAVDTTQIVTFNAVGAPTDRLIIKLFDGKTTATQWFKPDTTGNYIYNSATAAPNAFTSADNALCIDTLTQDFPDEYVQNTPDSIVFNPFDKLSFSGDYRIAHILPAQSYTLLTCKGAVAGQILLGASAQTGGSCTNFDFESASTGYCTTGTNLHKPSRFVLQASQPFELTTYTIKMEILVNGNAGEHGVYWSSTAPTFGHFASTSSTDGACASDANTGTFTGVISYLRGDGSTSATPVGPISGNCAGVAAGAKAVTINTTANSLFVLGDSFLYVNFPPFNYNQAEVSSGDVVSVRVTLSKSTCGVVQTITIPIGTFGCIIAPPVVSNSLLFPYFSSLSAGTGVGDFWNGIAVINTSSTAGTANFTAQERDGSVGTFSVAIPAKGMYVNLLELIPWVGTGLGNSQCYITVTTDFAADGFGMIAKETTGESMGYLPRLQ
jgi:hypothetical protein